jgi:uncharacterized protein YgiM (DUF1202 family)
MLLAGVLAGSAYYLFFYIPKHAKAGEPVLALLDYVLTYAPIEKANEPAYILPDSLEVWNTPALIRRKIHVLKAGEEVRLLGQFRTWAHVRIPNGGEGWVRADGLLSAAAHQAEQRLLNALSELPAQAEGKPIAVENLHIEPSGEAAVVARVNPDQNLEIFARRLVERSPEPDTPQIVTVASNRREAWYLVRSGSHAGWVRGRRVRLDIPPGISVYAQDTNLVAWLVLNTVNDNGKMVPQYVVAERERCDTCDFTKVMVLTWWKRKQTYAIAFRQGGLQGYFPILVTHEGTVPYFRLRLMDEDGNKYQLVYGLFDTITRPMGTAEGWSSDALPERLPSRRPRHKPDTRWPAATAKYE